MTKIEPTRDRTDAHTERRVASMERRGPSGPLSHCIFGLVKWPFITVWSLLKGIVWLCTCCCLFEPPWWLQWCPTIAHSDEEEDSALKDRLDAMEAQLAKARKLLDFLDTFFGKSDDENSRFNKMFVEQEKRIRKGRTSESIFKSRRRNRQRSEGFVTSAEELCTAIRHFEGGEHHKGWMKILHFLAAFWDVVTAKRRKRMLAKMERMLRRTRYLRHFSPLLEEFDKVGALQTLLKLLGNLVGAEWKDAKGEVDTLYEQLTSSKANGRFTTLVKCAQCLLNFLTDISSNNKALKKKLLKFTVKGTSRKIPIVGTFLVGCSDVWDIASSAVTGNGEGVAEGVWGLMSTCAALVPGPGTAVSVVMDAMAMLYKMLQLFGGDTFAKEFPPLLFNEHGDVDPSGDELSKWNSKPLPNRMMPVPIVAQAEFWLAATFIALNQACVSTQSRVVVESYSNPHTIAFGYSLYYGLAFTTLYFARAIIRSFLGVCDSLILGTTCCAAHALMTTIAYDHFNFVEHVDAAVAVLYNVTGDVLSDVISTAARYNVTGEGLSDVIPTWEYDLNAVDVTLPSMALSSPREVWFLVGCGLGGIGAALTATTVLTFITEHSLSMDGVHDNNALYDDEERSRRNCCKVKRNSTFMPCWGYLAEFIAIQMLFRCLAELAFLGLKASGVSLEASLWWLTAAGLVGSLGIMGSAVTSYKLGPDAPSDDYDSCATRTQKACFQCCVFSQDLGSGFWGEDVEAASDAPANGVECKHKCCLCLPWPVPTLCCCLIDWLPFCCDMVDIFFSCCDCIACLLGRGEDPKTLAERRKRDREASWNFLFMRYVCAGVGTFTVCFVLPVKFFLSDLVHALSLAPSAIAMGFLAIYMHGGVHVFPNRGCAMDCISHHAAWWSEGRIVQLDVAHTSTLDALDRNPDLPQASLQWLQRQFPDLDLNLDDLPAFGPAVASGMATLISLPLGYGLDTLSSALSPDKGGKEAGWPWTAIVCCWLPLCAAGIGAIVAIGAIDWGASVFSAYLLHGAALAFHGVLFQGFLVADGYAEGSTDINGAGPYAFDNVYACATFFAIAPGALYFWDFEITQAAVAWSMTVAACFILPGLAWAIYMMVLRMALKLAAEAAEAVERGCDVFNQCCAAGIGTQGQKAQKQKAKGQEGGDKDSGGPPQNEEMER